MNRAKARPRLLLRKFYDRSPDEVARALLGKVLVRDLHGERLAGRIGIRKAADQPLRFLAVDKPTQVRSLTLLGPMPIRLLKRKSVALA